MNNKIKKEIHAIRSILECFEKSDFHSMTSFYHSSSFPKGCCGDASDLIGLYLLQCHGIESEYVCGKGLRHNSEQSHAWLTCQGYIIDITADQFNENNYQLPKVIIEAQSPFHNSFKEYTCRPITFEYLRTSGIPSVLAKVISKLKESEVAL
ncbi:hypothetical protein [Neptunomonas marina]|uniref:Microcin J25-processing protein McjB C-terminal domain-containing protein n=1 Tax=Neptunomonas marina TaxID=1815562 RepID=A0A437Q174_9GAMM|nr:hypothetical protein [Neptunomonas marina]RVU28256.1 hypothetical protein EOE65_17835 [Neptunomonas marina]